MVCLFKIDQELARIAAGTVLHIEPLIFQSAAQPSHRLQPSNGKQAWQHEPMTARVRCVRYGRAVLRAAGA